MNSRSFSALPLLALVAPLWAAEPVKLSEADSGVLMERAQSVQKAYEEGNVDRIIQMTHPAILKFFPSNEAFEEMTREAIKSLQGKVAIESNEWGTPTAAHTAGPDEVCFLPKTTIMRIGDKRARSTSFLICVRKKGTAEWLFLDSSPLQKDPSILRQLLPELPVDIATPPNKVELL